MTETNPAVVPDIEVEQPRPRTYRVTAPSEVLGRDPGTEFTETIPVEQMHFLLDIGALELVEKPPRPSRPAPAVPAAAEKKE